MGRGVLLTWATWHNNILCHTHKSMNSVYMFFFHIWKLCPCDMSLKNFLYTWLRIQAYWMHSMFIIGCSWRNVLFLFCLDISYQFLLFQILIYPSIDVNHHPKLLMWKKENYHIHVHFSFIQHISAIIVCKGVERLRRNVPSQIRGASNPCLFII